MEFVKISNQNSKIKFYNMKKLILLSFVGILSSCGMKSIQEDVLILSKSDYEFYYFSNNFENKSKTITDSLFYGGNDFLYSTSKKDKRPYSMKICRTDITSADTIKLITDNTLYTNYQIGSFESFNILEYYQNESEILGKNYPNKIEFSNYLKSIQSNNYFELLPNQDCITLEIKD